MDTVGEIHVYVLSWM